jgi:hypothetical protein
MPRTPRVFVLLALALAIHAQDPVVTFHGEDRSIDALPADAAPAVPALKKWLPFAHDLGYRLVLSDDRKVLLVLSPTYARRGPKKEHHDVEVMLGQVRDTVVAASAFTRPPDGVSLVVIGVRRADYAKLLAQVVAVQPSVKGWAEGAARSVTGFILSDPLVAGFVEDPEGVEEWQIGNELVHRTAQLLVRSSAPQLPPWLIIGLGWHVEDTVCSSVYCFPHRTGFVSDAEHTDWGLCLANNFKVARRKKDGRPPNVTMEEFADWRPETGKDEFTTGRAYVAFGVARFLAHEHPNELMSLMKQMSDAIEKGSKTWTSDTEWRTNPDFRVSVADQIKLLNGVTDGFLAKVTDYFVKKKANERHAPAKKRT